MRLRRLVCGCRGAPQEQGAGSRGGRIEHPLTWWPRGNPWEGRPLGARRRPEPLPAGGWHPPRGGAGRGGPTAARGCTWRRIPAKEGEQPHTGLGEQRPRAPPRPRPTPPGPQPPTDCPEAGLDLAVPGSLSRASWCAPSCAMSSPHTPRIPLAHQRSLQGGRAQASPSVLVLASGKVWMTAFSQVFARIPLSGHIVGSTGCVCPLEKPVWRRHLGPATQSP